MGWISVSRLLILGFGLVAIALAAVSSALAQEQSKSKDASSDPRNLRSSARRSPNDQRLSDQEMTRQLLDGIKKLQSEGKLEAARRQAADAAARAPNPATQAASRIADVN